MLSKPKYHKIVVVGASDVGKSSLIRPYCEDLFRESYLSTTGVAFFTKSFNITLESGKKCEIILQIWKISERSTFSRMRAIYLKGSQGAIIIFDLSRPETFEFAKKYINEAKEEVAPNIPFVLIGNKVDLIDEIQTNLNRKEIQKFAENKGGFYVETSMKSRGNFEEAIHKLTLRSIEFVLDKRSKRCK